MISGKAGGLPMTINDHTHRTWHEEGPLMRSESRCTCQNSNIETRISKQIRMTEIQMTETPGKCFQNGKQTCFEHSKIWISNLFRISKLEFRIFMTCLKLVIGKAFSSLTAIGRSLP